MQMANAAAEFTGHVKAGNPRWLTFLGRSGTGKTYLARGLAKWCEERYAVGWSKFKHWPTLLGKLRGGSLDASEAITDLSAFKLLVVDEIGMGADVRDYGLDCLLRLMEGRKRGWTVFTSNLTLKQLAAIDERIASRLLRMGAVVECNTKDYALRRTQR